MSKLNLTSLARIILQKDALHLLVTTFIFLAIGILAVGYLLIQNSNNYNTLAARPANVGGGKVKTTPTPTSNPLLTSTPTSTPLPLTPTATPTPAPCANSTGNVQVLAPNGGETYSLGTTMTIKWCVNDYSQYNQSYASIWLATKDSSGANRNQVQISSNTPMQAGENSLNWTIPSTISVGGNYEILVNINSFYPNYDYSNNTFTISSTSITPLPTGTSCANSTGNVQVKYPNGGETFTVGNTVQISWCLNNYSQYSQTYSTIWLSSRQTQVDGSYVYQNQLEIGSQMLMQLGSNSYSWTIPDSWTVTDPVTHITTTYKIGGGSYVILVTINGSGSGSYDYSDNTFTITP